jgi:molybdate transport system ATP-binding protein
MTLKVTLRAVSPVPLDLEFQVAAGEILALVGPSGAGKTTVLRAIAGFSPVQSGRVSAGDTVWQDSGTGRMMAPHQRHCGVVFQSYALFPHQTARANVMAGMARPDPAKADLWLERVNLGGFGARLPGELSGGQQQRVALARALAREPAVLLLDEPFSAVDHATRAMLHSEVLALRDQRAMPVVLVTHDMAEAQLLADRLAVMDKGRLVALGPTAEVMTNPAALRAMGLRELASLLPARIVAQEEDGLTRLETATGPIWLPHLPGAAGAVVRVRILAHEVIVAKGRPEGLSAQNILPATVTRISAGDGPGMVLHLAIGPDEILARVTRRAVETLGLSPGEPCFAVLKSMSVARDHVAQR